MNTVRQQLQPEEEIVYVAHPTRLTLVLPLLVTLAIIGSTIVIWFQTNAAGVLLAGGAVALIGIVYLLIRLIVLRSNEFVVTTRRIIKQTGILNKRSTDIYLDKINNVDHYQSFWARMLGYGDVEIDTASESGTTRFPMVAAPLHFKQTILSTAQDFRTSQLRTDRAATAATPVSGADRLRQLNALLGEGLITQKEFDERRQKLIEEL